MPNVGTASIDIDVDAPLLGRNIRRAVDSQSSGISSAFRKLGGIGGDAISAGFRSTLRIAENVGAAAAVAGVALGGFGLKVAADFQQTRIAFEGILGSAEKAQAFLTTLRDFAAKTPFEFPELATAAKQLLAVGFNANDVIPIMTKLGNVAAALGVGGDAINGVVRALGQMKGKGKASAEELNQISEAIPGFSAVGAIADDMGISVAAAFKLMEKGALPADRAISAILKGMEKFPGAAGAMERQSKTLNGVISTLKDTFRDALIDGIEPFLPAISSGLESAAPKLKTAITGIVGAIKTAVVGVKAAFAAFSGEGVTSDGFVGGMERIGVAVRALVADFKQAWPQIKAVVLDVTDRLVTAFDNVVGWVRENWPEIKTIVGETMTTIQTVIAGVVDTVQTLWKNFGEQIVAFTKGHWDGAVAAVSGALEFIRGITETVTGILHGDWSDAWDGIKGIFTGAWDFLRGGQEMFNAAFSALASSGMEVVRSAFSSAWDGIKGVFSAGLGWILDKFLGFVETFVGLAAKAFGWVPGIGPKLQEAANAVREFRDNVNSYLDGIKDKTVNVRVNHVENYATTYGPGLTGGDNAEGGPAPSEGEQLPDRAHGIDEGPLPGRIGTPMLVRAHAGEWVVTPEQFESLTSGRSGAGVGAGVGGAGPSAAEIAAAIVAAFDARPPRAYVVSSDVARGLAKAGPR